MVEGEIVFSATRCALGRVKKARGGGYAGGRPAIGYHAGNRKLEVDNEKIDTVKRVFELYASNPGIKLQWVANILNKEGHTTAMNTSFYPMQVKRILERKHFYQGQYVYGGIVAEGVHEPII